MSLTSKLRRRAKRAEREIRGWVLRRQLANTEPRVLEILDHTGESLEQLQRSIAAYVLREGAAAASTLVQSAMRHAPQLISTGAIAALHVATIRALSEVDLAETVRFGDACLPPNAEARNLHVLAVHHRKAGNFERAIALLDRIGNDPGADATTKTARRDLRFELAMELLLRGSPVAVAEDDDVAIRSMLEGMLAVAGTDETLRWIAYRMFVRDLKAAYLPRTRGLLAEVLEGLREPYPPHVLTELSLAYTNLGHLTRARELVERAPVGGDPRTARQKRNVATLLELCRSGFHYTPRVTETPFVPVSGRVLYLLHHSLPFHSNGYATRSHGLLMHTRERGWNISAVTRLGYPGEFSIKHRDAANERTSVIDGVSYARLPRPVPGDGQPLADYLIDYANAVYDLARRERPEILHAAANHQNGLVANAVARALGIKSIYEVRGLWEVTRGSREPQWMTTEQFQMMRDLELQAAREADAVVVITRALGDEMVRRGVPADKIKLIPNGVDVDRFTPRVRDEALAKRLGLSGKRVFGYVGSLVDYEGLDQLLHAAQRLTKKGVPDFAVLIVGDGVVLSDLKKLAEELGITKHVVFTGRVPHHEVESHYSVIDIAVFPRRSLPVTEMVSPLKPLEAMAMEKIVIASSVGALSEMIEPGVNGLVFRKDDIEDLTAVLESVISSDAARPRSPRAWVSANRSWRELTGTVDTLYKSLASGQTHG